MRTEDRRSVGPYADFEIPKTIFTPPIALKGRIFEYRRTGDHHIESTTPQEAQFMMTTDFRKPVIIAAGVATTASGDGEKTTVSSNSMGIDKAEELLQANGFKSE